MNLLEKDLVSTSTSTKNVYRTKFDEYKILETINENKPTYALLGSTKGVYIAPNVLLTVDNINKATNFYKACNYTYQGNTNIIWQSLVDGSYLPHELRVGARTLVFTEKKDIQQLLNSCSIEEYLRSKSNIKIGDDLGNGQIITDICHWGFGFNTTVPDINKVIRQLDIDVYSLTLFNIKFNQEGEAIDAYYTEKRNYLEIK